MPIRATCSTKWPRGTAEGKTRWDKARYGEGERGWAACLLVKDAHTQTTAHKLTQLPLEAKDLAIPAHRPRRRGAAAVREARVNGMR